MTYVVKVNDWEPDIDVTVRFDLSWAEWVYTIDGKGPYSHSSYEYLVSDLRSSAHLKRAQHTHDAKQCVSEIETSSEDETHIEKMARVMCGGCASGKECMRSLCADWYKAEALYEAGCRMVDQLPLYIVVCDWSSDSAGESGVKIIGASFSKEEARKIMKAQVEKEKRSLPYRFDSEERSEDHWEAYESGYYIVNHVCVSIKETLVSSCDDSQDSEVDPREWVNGKDDIDVDCIHQFEFLLGRELKDEEEYVLLDSMIDEMILEYETQDDFFDAYPEMKKYRFTHCVKE